MSIEKTIHDKIVIRGKDYYQYLELIDKVSTMKTALNKFTQLRKDLNKGRGDRLSLSEFANYVDLKPTYLKKILKL